MYELGNSLRTLILECIDKPILDVDISGLAVTRCICDVEPMRSLIKALAELVLRYCLILMHLARGLSLEWIIPPCVRPFVHPSPSSGKLKTYVFAPYCLKFQKLVYVFYNT